MLPYAGPVNANVERVMIAWNASPESARAVRQALPFLVRAGEVEVAAFEATCVAMLHVAGVGLEAALTATILLRSLTTWLPMAPGLLLIRRDQVDPARRV